MDSSSISAPNAYLDYYWKKNLENGIPSKNLLNDRSNQLLYPKASGICNIQQKLIFEMMDAYSCIVPSDVDRYNNVMESILRTSDKSTLVLFNHDNFATMALFIRELFRFLKKIAKKQQNNSFYNEIIDLEKDLHIVIGPTITVQKQVLLIKKLINIIKTIPANDQIPGMEKEIKTVKSQFVKFFLELSDHTNNMVMMAPTGTRDVILRNPDGTIKSIIFKNDDGIKNTANLIKKFSEKDNNIVLVGTNGTGLKRPGVQGVKPTDDSWTPSDVYIDVKKLNSEECIELIDSKKLMHTIAELVKDHKGNQIGEVVDPALFDVYKKEAQKQPLLEKDLYQNYYFKDSLRKKTVRGLFKLLK